MLVWIAVRHGKVYLLQIWKTSPRTRSLGNFIVRYRHYIHTLYAP